ncbi:MAG: HAD hydrolase-like protein [Caldisericia bacterium]
MESRFLSVMIGDQLSTDIKGAKKAGLKAIFVDPVNPNSDLFWTKLRRRLSKEKK